MDTAKKHLVYLTGFMGSGKSTLAPILANTLGYTHVDLDHEIERTAGKTVAELFRDEGEAHFRRLERQVLEEASRGTHCVISLGGGTLLTPPNLATTKSTGVLVYLKTDLEQICRRMKHKTDRPVLLGISGERLPEGELRERIREILEAREPFYAQADITIETDDRRIGMTVDRIVRSLAGIID